MILQVLARYYQRISLEADSGMAPEGFETKGIPFVIVLDRKGTFGGIEDTRVVEGKKKVARTFIVPKAAKRSSGIEANLLWDNPAYAFGRPKPDPTKDPKKLRERAKEQHESFISRIKKTFLDSAEDKGVAAVIRFLDGGDFSKVFAHPLWKEIEESGVNVTFKLHGDTELICQRDAVRTSIASGDARGEVGALQQCLVTGALDSPARLHAAIKGVWGAQTSGANIVSFNLRAFSSFGKEQGHNAPVGEKAEHAYTTALNRLLARDSRQRMQVGDASVVFWAEKSHPLESWFSDFFGEAPKGGSPQDTEAVRALYRAPETGAPPLENDYTKFYVLGLSPNASRLSVRFWYDGTVAGVVKNIKQHFNDCDVVHREHEPEHLSLFRLLVSTALESKSDNIMPNLSGNLMNSILAGTPYPATLLSAAVRRIRAEREITYPRVSLIKACLVRDARYYKRNRKEIGMALDLANTNIGYRLGRLFSVLEKIQEEASPGINATIRDRFFGAASSSPVTAFPHLMKLKNYHLAKLENRGRAVNLERLVSEIVDGIVDFPPHLSLQDQGRFSVGYYHQRQALFTKKTIAKEE